jgi:hypothetical protein
MQHQSKSKHTYHRPLISKRQNDGSRVIRRDTTKSSAAAPRVSQSESKRCGGAERPGMQLPPLPRRWPYQTESSIHRTIDRSPGRPAEAPCCVQSISSFTSTGHVEPFTPSSQHLAPCLCPRLSTTHRSLAPPPHLSNFCTQYDFAATSSPISR